jgi:hypothetical protein
MPYINRHCREYLDVAIAELIDRLKSVPTTKLDGEVDYAITMLVSKCYSHDSFFALNRAIGVLESVKLEFYRRIVAMHEDKKKEENGDVF